jgi:hypothetical protein
MKLVQTQLSKGNKNQCAGTYGMYQAFKQKVGQSTKMIIFFRPLLNWATTSEGLDFNRKMLESNPYVKLVQIPDTDSCSVLLKILVL